jgi:hypothetical protein
VRLLRHSFLDEAADVRQAGVGSARAARLDRRRVRVEANDAHALVRLNAGGGHVGTKTVVLQYSTTLPGFFTWYWSTVLRYEFQILEIRRCQTAWFLPEEAQSHGLIDFAT